MNPNNPIDLSWLFTAIATFLGSFGTWFFTRRQYRAQARQTELDSVEKAVGIWRSTAEDLKKEVEQLRGEVKELQKLVSQLHKENITLKEQIAKFST